MSVNVNTTNNIVTVTQNSNTTVTVQSPGLIGPPGTAGLIPADNIIQPFNSITSSANISASGTVYASGLSVIHAGSLSPDMLFKTSTDHDLNVAFEAGVTTPQKFQIKVRDQSSTFDIASDVGGVVTNIMSLSGSGNVGIGTSTPTAKLEVVGNISASGINTIAGYDLIAGRDVIVGRSLGVIGDIIHNGSSNFGNSADDTHSFTGHIVASSAPIFAQSHITASGNISSSGAIRGGSYFSDSSYAIGTIEVLKYESGRIVLPDNLTIEGSIQADQHITASGNISASGTGSFKFIELAPDGAIQPSVNGSTISFRNAPHNSADWMEIGDNLFNVYMDGGGSLTVTPTVLLLNSNATNQDVKINYNDISSAFISDAASHFTRMSGPIVISRSGSGATTPLGSGFNPVTDGNSALQLSGSLYLHGPQSHITASGNISSSGNVTADNFIVGNGGYIRPAVAGGSINFSPYSHGSQEILAMSANAFAVRMDNYDVINISPTTFTVNGGNNDIDFKLHNEDSSLAIHNDASVNRLKFNGFTTITVSGSFNNPHADVSVFGTNTALLVSGSQAVIGDFDVSGNITSSIISAGKSGGSGAVNIYAGATASLYTSASLSEIRFENLPTTPPIVTGSLWVSGSSIAHPGSGYLMVVTG